MNNRISEYDICICDRIPTSGFKTQLWRHWYTLQKKKLSLSKCRKQNTILIKLSKLYYISECVLENKFAFIGLLKF